jgi:lysophospholipase L1-like esterase
VRKFSSAMGWPDTWSSGVGGTGYLNDAGGGGKVKFRDRLATDVIAYSPDIVVWAGGHNDTGYTAAALQAEALACFQAVAAALPNCQQVVLGIIWNTGVDAVTAAVLDADAAIKAAAVAAGIPFVGVIEGPTDNTLTSTTLASGSAASATTISVTTHVAVVRSTIQVGSGSTRERRVVTNIAGAGPFTYTVSPGFTNAHSSGEAVTPVGSSFITGTGRVGTTTGAGNADLLISSDATHFSQAGHDAFGLYAAQKIAAAILAA